MGSEPTDIQLFLSNRLESLAEALIARISRQPPHPLQPDTVVVQNRGMTRWLNLQIAELAGIQMNTRYLYPGNLIEQLISAVDPLAECNIQAFSQNPLFWRIYLNLPKWSSHNKASVLKRYLEADSESLGFMRRYQLAKQIARHLHELQTYRPYLLLEWAKEKEPGNWRSLIWKSLVRSTKDSSPPNLFDQFGKVVGNLKSRPSAWPESLHIFAISSLPPIYTELLKQAARWMPVSIYLTQPSPLYWGDQLSRKSQLKKATDSEVPNEGHLLLGNLGKQGQDFLNVLIDAEVFTSDATEYFSEPKADSLLSQIQSDLYHITVPERPKTKIQNIAGVEIHACHSPRREIESLKDQLLFRFEQDPKLTPDQIIIMAPDIEAYSASIRSVFGNPQQKPQDFIPYSIADYGTRSSSMAAHAFLSFLELLECRLTSNEVLNFLSIPVMSERFDLKEDDWSRLRTWIKDTNIRWGIDSEHRKKSTGIAFVEYSWKQGIEQLVSGYLIHPDEISDLKEMLPYQDMEGTAISLLNRFLEFWNFIEFQQRLASTVQEATDWFESLREIIMYLFQGNDALIEETQHLLSLLAELEKESQSTTDKLPLTLKIIRGILEDRLSQDYRAGSYFSGTVTFCSLMPMRNVPAKFIGLIGMNENAFPRQDSKSEFTTFPDGPKPGDRSRRMDDRYLFLESLLSAREHLYISYSGIDSQTLKEQPSSIVVEELLDSLDEYYQFPEDRSARKSLVKKEPLQAFSPSYFDSTKTISYSKENLDAAKSLVSANVRLQGLNPHASAHKAIEVPKTLPWENFLRFFKSPCRYWLNNHLEIGFPYTEETLEEVEPIESDSLINYHWGNFLLENPELLSGENQYLLKNTLPVGALKTTALEKLLPTAKQIITERNRICTGNRHSVQINLRLNHCNLEGHIKEVSDNKYVKVRFGKIRPVDVLSTWIEHLCLSAATNQKQLSTHFIGTNETLSMNPVSNPLDCLHSLESLFLRGGQSPLPFFPATSYAFAKAKLHPSPRARSTPWESAKGIFMQNPEGRYGRSGEAYDDYIKLCFPDPVAALTEEFETVALEVYANAINHTEGGPI
jgi:exodeoxyribonuclease V gamma subunit